MSLRQRRHQTLPQNADEKQKPVYHATNNSSYNFKHICGVAILIAILIYVVNSSYSSLPPPYEGTAKHEFDGRRAQKHLFDITDIGARVSGSYANDIATVDLLVARIKEIKQSADDAFRIDIDVQQASGSFLRHRRVSSMISAYQNITNVVVKISAAKKNKKDHSAYLLVNAHYDTVMNTEGATDDAISCAIMLEMLRCIAHGDQLKHGIIFLFNGAEEGGIAGSHAFVKSHKWFPLVKAFVNLEGAGSGGKDLLFQAGPQHPWILHSYVKAAKYPMASVFGQEIFETGIISSDTDFRVFTEHGKLSGVDVAFFEHGHVYHTVYDNAKSIPIGSLQRGGENMLQLVKTMAESDYLEDPGEYRHGKTVFYDVLGLFMIHYPLRMHLMLCYITSFTAIVYVFLQLIRGGSESSPTFGSLLLAMCVYVGSIVCSFGSVFGVAYFLVKMDAVMTWFTHIWFALPLYGFPSLFGYVVAYYVSTPIISKCFPEVNKTRCLLYAALIFDSLLLLIANNYGMRSSFIIWWRLFFTFLLVCLPNYSCYQKVYLSHLICVAIHGTLSIYCTMATLKVASGMVASLGGSEIASDFLIAALVVVALMLTLSYMMTLLSNFKNLGQCVAVTALLSVTCVSYALTGHLDVYSVNDEVIVPKRLYLQHTLRTFYNADGTERKQDSGLWVLPTDYYKAKGLTEIPFFKETKEFKCQDSYCGLPYYYPLRKLFRKQWYLLGEKPELGHHPLTTSVYRREVTVNNSIRFYFNITGPDHMLLFLTPEEGVKLSDWSFYKHNDGVIHSMSDYHESTPREAFVVFYSHGYHAPPWCFWIEFESSIADGIKLAELGIARHYLHGEKARTKFLKKAISSLPKYYSDSSWTSNYDSFTLV